MSHKRKNENKDNNISPELSPEVSLELTERDLKNPGVAKRILADKRNLWQEVGTLKESLKISQNSFEKLREKYHQSDKENAVLKQKVSVNTNFEIIKALSSIGFGSAVTFALREEYIVAAVLGVLSLIIFISAVIRRDAKL